MYTRWTEAKEHEREVVIAVVVVVWPQQCSSVAMFCHFPRKKVDGCSDYNVKILWEIHKELVKLSYSSALTQFA